MVEPCPEMADTQLGNLGGMLILPKELCEVAEESIVLGDRFGAQTLAGVVESETFKQTTRSSCRLRLHPAGAWVHGCHQHKIVTINPSPCHS